MTYTADRFTFKAPEGVNATKLPVYSGKVLVSGSNGEELGVPYFGNHPRISWKAFD